MFLLIIYNNNKAIKCTLNNLFKNNEICINIKKYKISLKQNLNFGF